MPAPPTSPRAILDHFSALSDPRECWRVVYPLPEVLLLVLCATLSGMEDFVEILLPVTGRRVAGWQARRHRD